jgi:hypothetical protein
MYDDPENESKSKKVKMEYNQRIEKNQTFDLWHFQHKNIKT